MKLKSLKEVTSYRNKKVLLRLDLDVPVGEDRRVDSGEDHRLQAVLPTINYLLKRGAEIIIVGHRGRPNGIKDNSLLLEPVVKRIAELLGSKNLLSKERINQFDAYSFLCGKKWVTVLENIRFYPGEVRNDKNLSKRLSKIADIYVNDAFAVSHRNHASISAITMFLLSFAGLRLLKEIKHLSSVLKRPKRPFTIIIGGVKAPTKLAVVEKFIPRADYILLGSALANNFYKALGFETGNSIIDKTVHESVMRIIRRPQYKIVNDQKTDILLNPNDYETFTADKFKKLRKRIILPIDAVVIPEGKILPKGKLPSGYTRLINLQAKSLSPSSYAMLDIGERTIMLYQEIIKRSKTIIWNGPMGMFEQPPFNHGTYQIAQSVSESRGKAIIGGGDTISAVESECIIFRRNTFISTGGGAMLEYLINPHLPGIKPLIKK